MELILLEQRKNRYCYFCGTDLSVKYVVEVHDHVLGTKPVRVYCCNKCVLTYNKRREAKQRRILKAIDKKHNWLLEKLKEAKKQPMDIVQVINLENKIKEIKIEKRKMEREMTQMDNCKHHLEIPTIGTCCNAYSQSKRSDGKHWAHYPECKSENCPLLHPELLEDATLETED